MRQEWEGGGAAKGHGVKAAVRAGSCGLFLLLLLFQALPPLSAEKYNRYYEPLHFSYDELVALSESERLEPALKHKLEVLLSSPFISNEAYYRGVQPHRPNVPGLGPSLRVVAWNIERGIRLDDIKLLFTDRVAFMRKAQEEGEQGTSNRERLLDEIEVLQSADVIVLNEVDWGLKRTGYRAVVIELADALDMNWAFGVEFVEVDPKVLGTETFEAVKDEKVRAKLLEEFSVDKERLRALHGTAILSRYPIREAKLRPFRLQGYDWFEGEKSLSGLEKTKRKAAGLVGEAVLREMRRGGRTALVVTLDIPDLPQERLTVAAPHLENRTSPKNRRGQMGELLDYLRKNRNPVVIAGDLNTTLRNDLPTSVKQALYKRFGHTEFYVNTGLKTLSGIGLGYDVIKWGFKSAKFQSDPTASGVRFLVPNKEAKLFQMAEKYRFEDGTAIDFRGDSSRTVHGRTGTLANSNERAGKGFSATYQVERTAGAKGKFKLDWIFVKSYLEDPRDSTGPYRFAPQFARTLYEANYALAGRISDHTPISVDLPFLEPEAMNRSE